jgi:hypothetical protein
MLASYTVHQAVPVWFTHISVQCAILVPEDEDIDEYIVLLRTNHEVPVALFTTNCQDVLIDICQPAPFLIIISLLAVSEPHASTSIKN